MKTLLTNIGVSILVYILNSEAVHAAIRDAAKKTTNSIDDLGAEAAIGFLKDLGGTLGKKTT